MASCQTWSKAQMVHIFSKVRHPGKLKQVPLQLFSTPHQELKKISLRKNKLYIGISENITLTKH